MKKISAYERNAFFKEIDSLADSVSQFSTRINDRLAESLRVSKLEASLSTCDIAASSFVEAAKHGFTNVLKLLLVENSYGLKRLGNGYALGVERYREKPLTASIRDSEKILSFSGVADTAIFESSGSEELCLTFTFENERFFNSFFVESNCSFNKISIKRADGFVTDLSFSHSENSIWQDVTFEDCLVKDVSFFVKARAGLNYFKLSASFVEPSSYSELVWDLPEVSKFFVDFDIPDNIVGSLFLVSPDKEETLIGQNYLEPIRCLADLKGSRISFPFPLKSLELYADETLLTLNTDYFLEYNGQRISDPFVPEIVETDSFFGYLNSVDPLKTYWISFVPSQSYWSGLEYKRYSTIKKLKNYKLKAKFYNFFPSNSGELFCIQEPLLWFKS